MSSATTIQNLFFHSLLCDTPLECNPPELTPLTAAQQAYLDKAKTYLPAIDSSSSEDLLSCFQALLHRNGEKYYHPHQPLNIERFSVFPNPQGEDFEAAWERLEKECKSLIANDLSQFNIQLFYLLKRYGWHFPMGSATGSLFERQKSLAAFATCLAQANHAEYPFILLCGDLSGIQRFIYDIYSSRAAMSMKGRSFYLHLLVDAILQQFIEETNTTIANVIYSSGGKFFLLLPNHPDVEAKISALEKRINQKLFDEYKDNLHVCIGYAQFNIFPDQNYEIRTQQDFIPKVVGLGDLWKQVSELTAKTKSCKFKSALKTNFQSLFTDAPIDTYNLNTTTTCAVTGLSVLKRNQNVINPEDSKTDWVYVSDAVIQQVKLGKALRKAHYLNVFKTPQKDGFNILQLGVYYSLTAHKAQEAWISYRINPTKVEGVEPFLFYGGNEQVMDAQNVEKYATHEAIAASDEGKSFNKLGVLRMDVDGLGDLFTKKMNEHDELKHFIGFSTVSSMLEWFFAGYLNTLRTEFKDKLNILYAGGDDVFVIGRWRETLEFANRVREEFRAFVGNHDKLSLSAGLVFVNPKFPITKAAILAGEALDEAKKYPKTADSKRKNAIHLLNETLFWETGENEFEFVYQLAQHFAEQLESNQITKGILYKFFSYQTYQRQGHINWMWESAYHLSRHIQLFKKSKRNIQTLNVLLVTLISGNFILEINQKEVRFRRQPNRMLDLICVAIQLADYLTR